jgi:hypothetical protein
VSWRTIGRGRVQIRPRKDGIDCIEILGSQTGHRVVSLPPVRKDSFASGMHIFARASCYWPIDARGTMRFEIPRARRARVPTPRPRAAGWLRSWAAGMEPDPLPQPRGAMASDRAQ